MCIYVVLAGMDQPETKKANLWENGRENRIGEGGNDVDDTSISGEPIDPTNVERYLSEYGRAVEALTSDHLRLQQFNYDRNVKRDKRRRGSSVSRDLKESNVTLDRRRSQWQEEQGYYDTAEDLFEGSTRALYQDTHNKLLETQQTLAGIYETMTPTEQQKITDILKNPSLCSFLLRILSAWSTLLSLTSILITTSKKKLNYHFKNKLSIKLIFFVFQFFLFLFFLFLFFSRPFRLLQLDLFG